MPTCEQSSGKAESLGNVSIAKTSKTGAFFCRVRTASLSKMTVFDGPQATQLTRCHPGSLSHPVFLFLAQPHDDVQVPHCELASQDAKNLRSEKHCHPGGQGCIYTSDLNLVSSHLFTARPPASLFCISPRCLLPQFVACCLHSWVLLWRKQFFCASRGFLLKKAGNRVVNVPRCDTSWYELYI